MTLFTGIKNISTRILGGQLESCIQLHQTNRP